MTDLCKALQSHVAKCWLREEAQQTLQKVGLKNVTKRHPRKEDMQCVQSCFDQVWLLGGREHKQTELVNQTELLIQRVLQISDLGLQLKTTSSALCKLGFCIWLHSKCPLEKSHSLMLDRKAIHCSLCLAGLYEKF